MPTKLKHLIRLGTHSEKKYFKEFKSYYDAILLNANMLALTTNSMSTFLGCELNKPFIIDPQTYAFQAYSHLLQGKLKNSNNSTKLKKSFEILTNKYGELTKNIILVEKRSLKSSDFNDKYLQDFCKNVIDYQLRTIKDETMVNSEYSEYIEYEIENSSCELTLKPVFLIAPYFYMTINTYKQWLDVNVNAINCAKEIAEGAPVYAQIVFDKDILLSKEIRNEILQKYKQSNADGFIIWIDKFDEKDVGFIYLTEFKNFIKNLQDVKKPIYQLYGSYFSIILSKDLLTGVCHGMEYGESRDVYPVGGGIPVSKFYYPTLHKRLLYRDALDILIRMDYLKDRQTYFNKVCSCKNCQEIIFEPNIDFAKYGDVHSTTFTRKNGNKESMVTMDYPTTDAKDLCLRHYLYNKINEYKFVNQHDYKEINDALKQAYNEYYDVIGDSIDYLQSWSQITEILMD